MWIEWDVSPPQCCDKIWRYLRTRRWAGSAFTSVWSRGARGSCHTVLMLLSVHHVEQNLNSRQTNSPSPRGATWQLELSVLRKQKKTRNSVDTCGEKQSEILNHSAADVLFVSNWSYLQNDWFLHDDCMSCWEARSETCGKSDFLFVTSPSWSLSLCASFSR